MTTDEQTAEEREFLDEWGLKRRRRRRRILLIVLGAVLLVIALPLLAGLIYDRYWQGKLDARVAQLRAKGRLVTYQQILNRDKELEPDQNSALVYMRAYQQEHDSTAAEVLGPLLGEDALGQRPSDQTVALLASQAHTQSQALRTILEAHPLQEGAYPLQPAPSPFDLLLPQCANARQATGLCGQVALLYTATGRPAQATPYLLAGFEIASSFGRKALLTEALTRFACDAMTENSLQLSLALCQFGPDELQKLRRRVQRERDGLSLDWPMVYVRSSGQFAFANAAKIGLFAGIFGTGFDARLYLWLPGWRQRDALFFHSVMDDIDRMCAMPPREALATGKQWSHVLHARAQSMYPPPVVSMVFPPALWRAVRAQIGRKEQLSIACAALAVEQYRLKSGNWPGSLDQLVPDYLDAVPEDYFGTGKIVYKRTKTGVLLYSFGPDGVDEGGVSMEEARKGNQSDAYDLPFRLLNPDLRGRKKATFRQEVLGSGVGLDDLKDAGLDEAALKRAGLTDNDLKRLRGNE